VDQACGGAVLLVLPITGIPPVPECITLPVAHRRAGPGGRASEPEPLAAAAGARAAGVSKLQVDWQPHGHRDDAESRVTADCGSPPRRARAAATATRSVSLVPARAADAACCRGRPNLNAAAAAAGAAALRLRGSDSDSEPLAAAPGGG
jgi:hypothetical protein